LFGGNVPPFLLPDLHKRACSYKFPFTQCFLCQSISANIPPFSLKNPKQLIKFGHLKWPEKEGLSANLLRGGGSHVGFSPLMHIPLKMESAGEPQSAMSLSRLFLGNDQQCWWVDQVTSLFY